MKRNFAGSLHRTAAFVLAAIVLYPAANTFPILRMYFYGNYTQNTIWSGTVALYKSGDISVAVIVFTASILIPIVKLLCLGFLVTTTALRWKRLRGPRVWAFLFIERIGKWAMLDVFAVAVLVSLMKLHGLGTIIAGPGAMAFACVVVLTMFASASFDPKAIWGDAPVQRETR